MIARIFLLFAVHFVTIPVFDVDFFLKLNCYKKKVLYLTEEPIEDHLFCENFHFSQDEVNEFQFRTFVISTEESIVFKNCDIGVLNHKFLQKFPKAISIQLDNVNFTMSPSKSINLPLRSMSIYGGNMSSVQNYRVWNNLTELRTFILGRTVGTYLKNKTVPNDFFKGNKHLESIKIFKEDIEMFQDFVVQDLQDLQSIALTDLKLKSLPTILFYKNGLLEYVNLSGNLFGRIPRNFYSVRMKHMTLMGCNITNVSFNDFRYKKQLEYLVLDGNNIKTFEKGVFEGLIHLRYLSIAGNELHNMTLEDFGEMRELEAINVEWNYLNTSNFLPNGWKNENLSVIYLNQWSNEVKKEKGTDEKFSILGKEV